MPAPKSFQLSPEVHHYLLAHTTPTTATQAWLIERTAALGDIARMQIAPEQGRFLTILAASLGATTAVEVGTFTGYSSLCLAEGLAPGGRLLCCDVSDEWTAIAREAWQRAGMDDRIELVVAPAAATLAALPADPQVDIAFIDADKPGYITYWDELVPRLRPGGLLLVDNVLWSGKVVDPDVTDPDTDAIRAFNRHAAADARVEQVMLPIADGLLVARKR